MSKKRAIISGTSNGIGKAIAEKFLKEGFEVFGYDVEKSNIDSKDYKHIICDIRNCEDIEKIDCTTLINVAGVQDEKNAIDVNLLGTIKFTEHFMNSKKLKSILFIVSASARNGSEFPYYVASKAGAVGYMKNLALNLAKRKIVVNSISPGGVITNVNKHILESEKLYKKVKKETLLGKWAEPDEIAEAAYFMCVINKSITGEDLLIDNGEILKSNFIW